MHLTNLQKESTHIFFGQSMQDQLPPGLWESILDRALELRFWPFLWSIGGYEKVSWIPWKVDTLGGWMRPTIAVSYAASFPRRECPWCLDHRCDVDLEKNCKEDMWYKADIRKHCVAQDDTLQSNTISSIARNVHFVSDKTLWDHAPRRAWGIGSRLLFPTLRDIALEWWSWIDQDRPSPLYSSNDLYIRSSPSDSIKTYNAEYRARPFEHVHSYAIYVDGKRVLTLVPRQEDAVDVIAHDLTTRCFDRHMFRFQLWIVSPSGQEYSRWLGVVERKTIIHPPDPSSVTD